MKKLLLIGDSIRMNYDHYVAQALEGQVKVCWPDENACFAAYTYYAIGDWEHKQRFGEDVDVIHWNVGLHDVIRFHYDDIMTPPEIYGYYLGRIIHRLRDVYPNAQQIFALSTPGRDEKYVLPWIVRKNKDIDKINEVALGVMAEHLMAEHGFQLDPRETILVGLCQNCREDGGEAVNHGAGCDEGCHYCL